MQQNTAGRQHEMRAGSDPGIVRNLRVSDTLINGSYIIIVVLVNVNFIKQVFIFVVICETFTCVISTLLSEGITPNSM